MRAMSYSYSQLRIGRQKILRIFLKTFNLVSGEPGFSWDISLVPCYYMVLIVNPMDRILVRWKVLETMSRTFATLSAIGCMCNTTHWYVCYDSYTCMTWLIQMCDMTTPYAQSHPVTRSQPHTCTHTHTHTHTRTHTHTHAHAHAHTPNSHARGDTFLGVHALAVAWHIHTCDLTHPNVWLVSFISVTWLNHMCDVRNSHVWHDSLLVWQDSFKCVP